MAQKVKRDVTRNLRLSPGEDAKLAEDAAAAGLEWSEYVRRECGIRNFGRSALRGAAVPISVATRPEGGEISEVPADFEQRVNRAAMRMSRSNAERTVRQEIAREEAQAALSE